MSALAPADQSPHIVTQPSPGQLIDGKYRLEERIGVGGMGAVHLATHVQLKQRVAIKFLHTEALSDAGSIERFHREAHAAVRLRSEHVARVLDLGTLPGGAPYTVMEYLHGSDLAQVLQKRGALPFQEAVEYVLQACEAVAEAHSAGIIHRDLKPSNLFLTQRVDGRPLVKVLDFGISKLSAELHQGAGTDAQLTRTSAIIGSPSYMSPEQLRSSRDVDPRTDVWSLGVIMFELMSHYLPFAGDSLTELTLRIAGDPTPSLRALVPGVPPAVEAAVMRCLEKNRDLRYASVIDLVRDIEPFADPLTASMAERLGRSIPSGPGAHPSGQLPPQHMMTPRVNSAHPPRHMPQQHMGSGSTSTAWTDTEMMPGQPAKNAPPKTSSVSWVVPVLIMTLLGGIGGTFAAMKWLAPPARPSAPELPLPEDRNHLPPAVVSGAPSAPVAPASGLPSTRMPIEAAPIASAKPTVAPSAPSAPIRREPKPSRTDLPDERK